MLAGIILLLLPVSSSGTQTSEKTYQTANEYCLELETKTKSLIMELDGVKNCNVAITLGYGYEYLYATDQRIYETYNQDGTTAAKEIEKNYITITSQNGTETVLLREKMPEVLGIAVVCTGASYETQLKILSLLTALYDVSSDKISVQA